MRRHLRAAFIGFVLLDLWTVSWTIGSPTDAVSSRVIPWLHEPLENYATLRLVVSEYAYPLIPEATPLRRVVVALVPSRSGTFEGFMGGTNGKPITTYNLKFDLAKLIIVKAGEALSKFQLPSRPVENPKLALELSLVCASGRISSVWYRPAVPTYEGPVETFLTFLDEAVSVPKPFRMGGIPPRGGRAIDALPATDQAPGGPPPKK